MTLFGLWRWFQGGSGRPAGDARYFLEEATFGSGRGFAVHRAADGIGIRWQALPRSDGLEALELEGLQPDSDALQSSTFNPGSRLNLTVESRDRVAVYDLDGDRLAGYLPQDRAPAIARQMKEGHKLTCVSLWEKLVQGRRVTLRVLLVSENASINLPEL